MKSLHKYRTHNATFHDDDDKSHVVFQTRVKSGRRRCSIGHLSGRLARYTVIM